MDNDEARGILTGSLAGYRALSYEELARRVDTVETDAVEAPSGVTYSLEIQFFWDAKPDGAVRVIGSIDDGGWRAFRPLSDDFIRAPDGSFVGK